MKDEIKRQTNDFASPNKKILKLAQTIKQIKQTWFKTDFRNTLKYTLHANRKKTTQVVERSHSTQAVEGPHKLLGKNAEVVAPRHYSSSC